MTSIADGTDYEPAGVFIHDGQGRRIAEIVDAVGKRSYRTMQVSRAMYALPENDDSLALCDPREGRFLVIQSQLYPVVWAGPIRNVEWTPDTGLVQFEALSYEAVLQERFLPSDFAVDGSAGAVFEALFRAVEFENPTGVTLSPNLAAGFPFNSTNYGDRSLFDSWNLVAQQTAHEWWLEHEVVDGQLITQAQFRPARGQDRSADCQLIMGPWGNVRMNRGRITVEGANHRIRAVGGATSATQAFSERSRVERRMGKSAPVSTATLVTASNTRHGYDFGRWPTGDGVLTRGERLAILENVRGAGSLAIAAEAVLTRGRVAQRAMDLEIQGSAQLWQYCTPGDVIRVNLPAPYFFDGIDAVATIIDTEVTEERGTMRITVEVPAA